jgi:hypothetical protein
MSINTTDFDRELLIQVIIDMNFLIVGCTYSQEYMRTWYASYDISIIRKTARHKLVSCIHKDHPACKKYLWMLPLL